MIRHGQIIGKINYIVEIFQHTTKIQATHLSVYNNCTINNNDLIDELKQIAKNHRACSIYCLFEED